MAENLALPQIPKDVLQDLCSRFLINIPDNEKNDMVRICFQIELAHWYYVDFCRQDDPDLPPCGMKSFIFIIFTEFSFLNKTRQSVQSIYENWRKYKVRVPVFGAILLDESLEKCLLVQGFHNKTSWGFPKGKINKDEEDLDCAIREVLEEVGYDIKPLAHSEQYLENNIHDHQVRLYIVAGVDESYHFKPNTRGEIKEIQWFCVDHLPTHKKDLTPKDTIGLMANNFFMIHSFVKPLRKWIADKKHSMTVNSVFLPIYANQTPDKANHKKSELVNKRLRDKQAADYKKMHESMNPLLAKNDDEDTLKALLGMKDCSNSPCSQPEAIRKLLTGTVEVTPDKKVSRSAQDSPFVFPFNSGNTSVDRHENKLNRSLPKSQRKDMESLPFETYAQKAGRGVSSQKNNESIRLNKPVFIAQRNSPLRDGTESQSLPLPKFNAPLSTSSRKLTYNDSSSEYQTKRQQNSPDEKPDQNSLSDFYFSAPAFANFKFSYNEIVTALG